MRGEIHPLFWGGVGQTKVLSALDISAICDHPLVQTPPQDRKKNAISHDLYTTFKQGESCTGANSSQVVCLH